MPLIFKEKEHKYESTDEDIKWTSVTTLVSKLKEKFDKEKTAKKCSANKNSKWYKIPPSEILKIWDSETNRALKLGNFYHNTKEENLLKKDHIFLNGKKIPIHKSIIDTASGDKVAPLQKLKEGIYPEHFTYLKSVGICGQADYVEVIDGKVNITDYKTNKKIEKNSYVNWEGISKKLYSPLSHLEDCNFNHYSLQMSIYMYMILKHNPKLKPGKLTLLHILFDQIDEDKYGYPKYKHVKGKPVIKEEVEYDIPYLKNEVISLLKWWKLNRK